MRFIEHLFSHQIVWMTKERETVSLKCSKKKNNLSIQNPISNEIVFKNEGKIIFRCKNTKRIDFQRPILQEILNKELT